jgi:murein DD-endopeptidase MepM/ murein hydrolase activator NlpD
LSPTGTGIAAAAAGVVVSAERHPQYGNLVEIDHGNDLTTRYAHASKMLVKPGQLVKRGQKIAEVGSTGRSTGPHLHFEVRIRGMAQNPDRFLRMAQNGQSPSRSRNRRSPQSADPWGGVSSPHAKIAALLLPADLRLRTP